MRLATIKHISSKNSNYGAAEAYLTFQHDEFTNKPILDERGRMIPRDDYRIGTILCGDEDFAIACMRANLKYKKNNLKGDVKSHHYIISFDPRDGTENGLTLDRAQELGMNYCREHFPGHQALVCTHPDGHNHSGNIHVHIVINSLRIEDVPFLPYMDRPCDTHAGMKHRCTAAALRYFRSEVMEMCHRENLYQIDLLNGSRNRITEREYHAKRRRQEELKVHNQAQSGNESTQTMTKYETDKEQLRKAIQAAVMKANSLEEFQMLLAEFGISVKESRGRFSYLTADRTKPITSRKLGDDYSKEAILEKIAENGKGEVLERTPDEKAKMSSFIPSRHPAVDTNSLERVVDMNYAQTKGAGYVNWAKVHNVKAMGQTLIALRQAGLDSYEDLEKALSAAHEEFDSSRKEIKDLEHMISEKTELRSNLLIILNSREIYEKYKGIKDKAKRQAFYKEHEAVFIRRDAAFRYFKSKGITKLPSLKALNTEIEDLISRKNEIYNSYREAGAREKELRQIKSNIDKFLDREEREIPARSRKDPNAEL